MRWLRLHLRALVLAGYHNHLPCTLQAPRGSGEIDCIALDVLPYFTRDAASTW